MPANTSGLSRRLDNPCPSWSPPQDRAKRVSLRLFWLLAARRRWYDKLVDRTLSAKTCVEPTHLTAKDVRYLDGILLEPTGRLRLLPASSYASIDLLHLRAWCSLNGRYGLPTTELVAWLKERIAGRSAVEIGAGCGDLGFRLGIPMTDSFQQVTDPATVGMLAQFRQAPATPLPDVEPEDAETAVRRRKPRVVIASWVAERSKPKEEGGTGNVHGPREEDILGRCESYIFVGNEAVHGKKRLRRVPHLMFKYPWLVSRARKPELNVIYLWEGQTMPLKQLR